MNDCWDEEMKLDDLAEVAGVHRVTVSKAFGKYFGCSFGEYRRRLRIERSFPMIRAKKSLTDVALDCGFFDQSHFTRTFKNLTGFSPKIYSTI
jgi:AraC family transcriptional regulator